MNSAGYSKDLDSLRDAVELQKRTNQEIVDFRQELEEFTLAKVRLHLCVFTLISKCALIMCHVGLSCLTKAFVYDTSEAFE